MRKLASSVALLLVAMLSVSRLSAGPRAEKPPSERITITWFNSSEHALVPADDCPVAQEIERRFNVSLELLGGPPGSEEGRYLQAVFIPVLQGQASLDELEEYRRWYDANGGPELGRIIERWQRQYAR